MYPQDSSDISTTKMISRMDEYYGGKENHFVIYITELHDFGNSLSIYASILIYQFDPPAQKLCTCRWFNNLDIDSRSEISIGFNKYIRFTKTFFINGNFQSTGAALYCG